MEAPSYKLAPRRSGGSTDAPSAPVKRSIFIATTARSSFVAERAVPVIVTLNNVQQRRFASTMRPRGP